MELLQGLPIPRSSLDVWWLNEEPTIVAAATAWHTNEQVRKGVNAAAILPLDGQTLFNFYLARLEAYFAKDRKNEALLNFKQLRQAKDGSPSMFLRAMRLLEPQLGGAIPPESFASSFMAGLDPEERFSVQGKYITVPREDWYSQLSAIAADADVVWSNVQHERLNRLRNEKEEPPPSVDRGPGRHTPASDSRQRTFQCDYHGRNQSHASSDCFVLQQQGSGQQSRAPRRGVALMSLLRQAGLLPQGGDDDERSVLASSSGGPRSRPDADNRRRDGATTAGFNRTLQCSYCARLGHDADNCLIRFPDRASEGWLPPGELLKAQFLANKQDLLGKAPASADKRKAVAASVKAEEEPEEGYESEYEDDYRSTHSHAHAHVSFAHSSTSSQHDATLTPAQSRLINVLRVAAFVDRTPDNCSASGPAAPAPHAAALATQHNSIAPGHVTPAPQVSSYPNACPYPWHAPGKDRPRPLPTSLDSDGWYGSTTRAFTQEQPPRPADSAEALATLTAQQVPLSFEPSEVKPDVYPPPRLATRATPERAAYPPAPRAPEATISFPLSLTSLPLVEAVLAFSHAHSNQETADQCNVLLAEMVAKLRNKLGPSTPPARATQPANVRFAPPFAVVTHQGSGAAQAEPAQPSSNSGQLQPDPPSALASERTTQFTPMPHAMRQGEIGSVSYTSSGPRPASRSLHQIPSEEMAELLASNLAAAGYFKAKQYMFYYPSGGLALKGFPGKLAALRDQCANTSLMSVSAA